MSFTDQQETSQQEYDIWTNLEIIAFFTSQQCGPTNDAVSNDTYQQERWMITKNVIH